MKCHIEIWPLFLISIIGFGVISVSSEVLKKKFSSSFSRAVVDAIVEKRIRFSKLRAAMERLDINSKNVIALEAEAEDLLTGSIEDFGKLLSAFTEMCLYNTEVKNELFKLPKLNKNSKFSEASKWLKRDQLSRLSAALTKTSAAMNVSYNYAQEAFEKRNKMFHSDSYGTGRMLAELADDIKNDLEHQISKTDLDDYPKKNLAFMLKKIKKLIKDSHDYNDWHYQVLDSLNRKWATNDYFNKAIDLKFDTDSERRAVNELAEISGSDEPDKKKVVSASFRVKDIIENNKLISNFCMNIGKSGYEF